MVTRPAPRAGRRRQRGAAILLALLIMTLVATLAAGMVWLQWRGIEVESAERARGEGEWLLTAALDWGDLILKSAVTRNHTEDDLTQPWATPLAETRLSSFLSADGSHSADGGPEAFLSGQITDAQSKYNLYNLVVAGGRARLEGTRFLQLCTSVGVGQDACTRIVSGFRNSFDAVGNAVTNPGQADTTDATLMPRDVDDLAWYGLDAKAIEQLRPYVTIFTATPGVPPASLTMVNANTASAQVLAVAFPGRPMMVLARLHTEEKPYRKTSSISEKKA